MTGPATTGGPATGNLTEITARTAPLSYSSVADEYAALRHRAIITDRSARGRLRASGARAAETLSGLLTNDVITVHPGHGAYAAALTPKGKIIADVRVFVNDGSIMVDTGSRAWPGWWATVRKFVNPRLMAYRDESADLSDLGVFGPAALGIVAEALQVSAAALSALPPFGHIAAIVNEHAVVVARAPDLGVDGYDVLAPTEFFDTLWSRCVDGGATPAGLAACEIARVEAGRPEWGLDMDDNTIAQEANLEALGAISYTKGCYTGQEVVARIHFRGHVNKRMMGLRAASIEPPPTASVLVDPDGKQVGDVRSAVSSPRNGGIALAMIRREIEPGARLVARWADGELEVDVVPLPFPS